jgi:hypothetical protein
MVCNRCFVVVKQELDKLKIDSFKVTLREVETEGKGCTMETLSNKNVYA